MSAVNPSSSAGRPLQCIEVLAKDVGDRVTELAKKAFELLKIDLYHTALVVAKALFIPILLASTVIVATAFAVTFVFDKMIHKTKLLPHIVSLLDELPRVIRLAAKYGLSGAVYHQADNAPNSPQFVHIKPKNEQKELAPVIVNPGYLDDPETMIDMCQEIADKSGRDVYIVKYYDRFAPIAELARDVNRVALHVALEKGSSKIIYGGHSMGGLTSGGGLTSEKHLIAQIGIDVRGWFTIGTPHNGTVMAHFGILGKCGREMRPESPFLQQYTQELPSLENVPQLHVYSDTDHVVPPRGLPPHGEHYKCKNHVGHLGVREQEDVLDKVVESMKTWDS